MQPKAALIVNPSAGAEGRPPASALVERLSMDFHVTRYDIDSGSHPRDAAARALAEGAELVIAAGGDGTVSAVANALVGGVVPLGVVPRGTSNSFAAALGIPDDMDAACALLATGERRVIDTARCGDRTMILHCMVGLHADAISMAEREDKRRFGAIAYAVSGARALSEVEPFEVSLEVGSRAIRCEAVSIAVANVAPTKTIFAQGPSEIVPDDRLLDVTIVGARDAGETLTAALHLLGSAVRGERATEDAIGYFSCRSLRIETKPAQCVLIDGEECGTTPLEITSIPSSLTVLAPRETPSRNGPEVKLNGLPGLRIEGTDEEG